MSDNKPARGPTGSERLVAQAGKKRGRLFNFAANGNGDLSARMMLGASPQSIGADLRAARQARGESTADVARQLCLRQSYIEAIEAGDFDDLPGITYATGFVRSYARYLDIDADDLTQRLKDEVSDIPPAAEFAFLEPVSESRVPRVGLIVVAIVMAVVAYGAWYYLSTRDVMVADTVPPVPEQFSGLASAPERSEPPSPPPVPESQASAQPAPAGEAGEPAGAPSAERGAETGPTPARSDDAASEQAAAEEGETAPPAPSPIPDVPAVAAPPDSAAHAATPATGESGGARVYGEGNVGSRITVRAGGDSWIQVRAADETLLMTRTLRRGESYLVPNQPGLKLMTGNAGMLEILVDGQSVPPLGPVGAVKRNVPLDAERLKAGTAAN